MNSWLRLRGRTLTGTLTEQPNPAQDRGGRERVTQRDTCTEYVAVKQRIDKTPGSNVSFLWLEIKLRGVKILNQHKP